MWVRWKKIGSFELLEENCLLLNIGKKSITAICFTMRVQTYQQMLSEYGHEGLDPDDQVSRELLLQKFPYAVIVQGGFMEYDTLQAWMKLHVGESPIQWLFYGKIAYDYGFAEYFFIDDATAKAVAIVVPHIYTIYPDAPIPYHTTRSNGYDDDIAYDPQDADAIVIQGVHPRRNNQ